MKHNSNIDPARPTNLDGDRAPLTLKMCMFQIYSAICLCISPDLDGCRALKMEHVSRHGTTL
jgi:hypothetical protein